MPKMCRFLPSRKTAFLRYIIAVMSVALACSFMPLSVAGNAASLYDGGQVDQLKNTTTVIGAVNLRTNPEGIGASRVLAVLSAGDNVAVVQAGETWCKVRTLKDPARVGWALCSYMVK